MQTLVVLINAHIKLSQLPRRVLLEMKKWLKPIGSCQTTTLAAQVLSGKVCMSARTIEAIHEHVKRSGWKPDVRGSVKPRGAQRADVEEENLEERGPSMDLDSHGESQL